MDRLQSMTVFTEVVDRGSFVAAAEALGMSRTAASKQVMDLETYLGTTLLIRTTRKTALTDAGTAYYERAKRILDLERDARNEASTGSQTAKGRLRISAPMSFGVRHLAPRLGDFLRAHPGVRVDLTLSDRTVDLIEERFDLTIRIGRLEPSSLIARKLTSTRLVLCAAPAYLEAQGVPKQPEDLSDHVCLGYPYASGSEAWQIAVPDGSIVSVPVRNALWCDNGDALECLARQGLGIIYQPEFILREALASGDLVEVLPEHKGGEVDVSVVYPPRAFMPLRMRVFIDFLVGSFSGDRPR